MGELFRGRLLVVLTRAVKDPQLGNHLAAAPRGRSREARSETMVCTRVYRCVCQGQGGQRAKRGVGSCWKTRLPNTKHTEGSCVRPGHLTTPTGAPGSSEAAESSSPGPPHRPPTCRGLRSDGGFLGHSLLKSITPQARFQLCRLLPSGHNTPNHPPHHAGLLRKVLAHTAGTIFRGAWAQSAGSWLPGRAGSPGRGSLGVSTAGFPNTACLPSS